MKKVTKSSRIRALIDKGATDSEIVRKLKVSPQLAYQVRKNYDKAWENYDKARESGARIRDAQLASKKQVPTKKKEYSDQAHQMLGWLTRALKREPLSLEVK